MIAVRMQYGGMREGRFSNETYLDMFSADGEKVGSVEFSMSGTSIRWAVHLGGRRFPSFVSARRYKDDLELRKFAEIDIKESLQSSLGILIVDHGNSICLK